MLVIVDTETSNIRSVSNAFKRLNVEHVISNAKEDISKATRLVLPGVGAFQKGMDNLHSKGLVDIIRQRAEKNGIPLLGICLGMQLLAEIGWENGEFKGLGLIRGEVIRLVSNDENYRIPNIGWCDVIPKKGCGLFSEDRDKIPFYHVHSYHMQCADPKDLAGEIVFCGANITVAVQKRNIFGVQFHPEKSQDDGLKLLDNFVNITR